MKKNVKKKRRNKNRINIQQSKIIIKRKSNVRSGNSKNKNKSQKTAKNITIDNKTRTKNRTNNKRKKEKKYKNFYIEFTALRSYSYNRPSELEIFTRDFPVLNAVTLAGFRKRYLQMAVQEEMKTFEKISDDQEGNVTWDNWLYTLHIGEPD